MNIKKTKSAYKVFLKNIPTERQLAELNAINNIFHICTKRGYARLLSSTPTSACLPCVMECPIDEWWTI